MKAENTIEQLAGQITIFDLVTWSGKMSPEPSAPTTAKTSEPSSKKRHGSKTPEFAFLDLRKDSDGHTPDASWVTDGALPGDYTTLNTGEYPSEEKESRLSQILEETPPPKYCLSPRACQGILNRAEKRKKQLPEILEKTLKKQASMTHISTMDGEKVTLATH